MIQLNFGMKFLKEGEYVMSPNNYKNKNKK